MPETMLMRSAANPGLATLSAACAKLPQPAAHPPPPCRLATLDPTVLDDLQILERRLGKRVLPEMLQIFERHTPPSCVQLWRAVDDDDATTLRQVSHKLKSSARCLGLRRLSELCANLETDARAGSLREAERQLAAIEDELQRGMTALRRFLGA